MDAPAPPPTALAQDAPPPPSAPTPPPAAPWRPLWRPVLYCLAFLILFELGRQLQLLHFIVFNDIPSGFVAWAIRLLSASEWIGAWILWRFLVAHPAARHAPPAARPIWLTVLFVASLEVFFQFYDAVHVLMRYRRVAPSLGLRVGWSSAQSGYLSTILTGNIARSVGFTLGFALIVLCCAAWFPRLSRRWFAMPLAAAPSIALALLLTYWTTNIAFHNWYASFPPAFAATVIVSGLALYAPVAAFLYFLVRRLARPAAPPVGPQNQPFTSVIP